MADPALNSVYLEAPRREKFREARQALFAARGSHTVCLESGSQGDFTAGDRPAAPRPVTDLRVLVDGRTQSLRIGLNTVGRLPDNDVIIPDAHVSRRHCAIVVHANRSCEVHDMASKNGTYLNGVKVAVPTSLKPGDEIRLGEYRVVFQGTEPLSAADKGGQTQVMEPLSSN